MNKKTLKRVFFIDFLFKYWYTIYINISNGDVRLVKDEYRLYLTRKTKTDTIKRENLNDLILMLDSMILDGVNPAEKYIIVESKEGSDFPIFFSFGDNEGYLEFKSTHQIPEKENKLEKKMK